MTKVALLFKRSEKAGTGRGNEGCFGSMNWYLHQYSQVFFWVHREMALPASLAVVCCTPCAWVLPNDMKAETHHSDRQLLIIIIKISFSHHCLSVMHISPLLSPITYPELASNSPRSWSSLTSTRIADLYLTTPSPHLILKQGDFRNCQKHWETGQFSFIAYPGRRKKKKQKCCYPVEGEENKLFIPKVRSKYFTYL